MYRISFNITFCPYYEGCVTLKSTYEKEVMTIKIVYFSGGRNGIYVIISFILILKDVNAVEFYVIIDDGISNQKYPTDVLDELSKLCSLAGN